MSGKIKRPCGIGDLMPMFIRGRWIYTSDCDAYRAFDRGETTGFSWSDLVELGVADLDSDCPDLYETIPVTANSEDRLRILQDRWKRYTAEYMSG